MAHDLMNEKVQVFFQSVAQVKSLIDVKLFPYHFFFGSAINIDAVMWGVVKHKDSLFDQIQ